MVRLGWVRLLRPGRRSRRRGRFASLLVILLCIGLFALGEAAPQWPVLDVLRQFRLQLGLGMGAFALAFLMPRARVLSGIVLFILGLIAVGIWPQLHSDRPDEIAAIVGARAVKVMSFNMSVLNRRLDLVEAEVRRIDPDILTLVEMGPEQLALMDRLKARYPFTTDCREVPGCYFAILSRFPFRDLAVERDWRSGPFLAVRFGPELDGLAVFGVHTLRFPHVKEQLIQYRTLAARIRGIAGAKIVMGDFNATGFSSGLARFARESGLRRRTWLPSWPSVARLPQLGIDHVFTSESVTPLTPGRIGRYAGSDHYPIYISLAVPVP